MPIRRASELFGIVNLVFFSPEDLNIIKNGPCGAAGGSWIWSSASSDKVYLSTVWSSYNRVLNQRNKLLKELHFHPEYEDTLDVWDMQLVSYGKQVIESTGTNLSDQLERDHRRRSIGSLSGGQEELCDPL